MIVECVECLGFDGMVREDNGLVRLQRVPEELRPELNPNAQQRVLSPACNELRCVGEGPVKLILSSDSTLLGVRFLGPFQHGPAITIGKEPVAIEFQPTPRLQEQLDRGMEKFPYAPYLYRLLLQGGGKLYFHGVEGVDVRSPREDEIPSRTLLTYGTSITHGAVASVPHLSYVRQLAWRLKADLINLGVGGACHAEPAFADYIARRTDWDIALLALSVNMIGAGFSPEEFYERVAYMVDTVAGQNPGKPVFCVTIYPHFRDRLPADHASQGKAVVEVYRQQLRDAVKQCGRSNVTLLEGPEILDDFGSLSSDLIHPGDLGMIRMGERLAAAIQRVISSDR